MRNKNDKPFQRVKKVLCFFYPKVWKEFKGYFFAGGFRLVIDAVRPFVAILVTPLIIDGLIGGVERNRLLLYAAVIAVGGTLLSLISSILGMVLEKYDEKFQNFFSEEMSRRVMMLDFALTEDKAALDQIEAARTGMSWYSGGVHGISQQFFSIIMNLITIAGVVVLVARRAPLLLLVILVLLLASTFINNKSNQIEIQNYKALSKLNRIFSYLGWETTDFRYGKDIRLYDAAKMMVQKWDSYTKECEYNWKKAAHDRLPYAMADDGIGIVRNIVFYLYLGVKVIFGKISIGVFSQMVSAAGTLHNALHNLIMNVQEIVKRCNYAEEYLKFMEYPAAVQKGGRHVEERAHTITFQNVEFIYPGTEVKALDGVTLTLHPGEHLSIVGLNGAGKTTFVKLLCRLYEPTAGRILLDGIDIREYDYKDYLELFSPVFQDFKLLAFTVKDNITLGRTCREEEVEKLLAQTGLSGKVHSMEKGMDTMLFKAFDEKGIEPSGGEQQKLAIARALYKKAPVVILDEPTAALDPIAEYDIYRQFDELVGGKTAVYISHRLSSCRFCDRIAVFSEGKIKEYGSHDELAALKGGIYAEMFAAQAQYYA